MSFNLICTADERTWSDNEKILFLGEGCLKHSRKNDWKNLNEITKKNTKYFNHQNIKINAIQGIFFKKNFYKIRI